MIEKEQVHKVRVVRHDSEFSCCIEFGLEGVYAVFGDYDSAVELELVGSEAQVHGELVDAEVCAAADYDECVDFFVHVEPAGEERADTGVQVLFFHDDVFVGEGQGE